MYSKQTDSVIPAAAGIQTLLKLRRKTNLDAGIRRHDKTSPGAGKALAADRITTRRRAEKARIREFQKRFGRLVSIHSELCV
jgi:hypothetical protein